MVCQRLGEVLGGLGLAGPGGALRRAVEVEVERAHQRSIAAISQRRYHQPARDTQTHIKRRMLDFWRTKAGSAQHNITLEVYGKPVGDSIRPDTHACN